MVQKKSGDFYGKFDVFDTELKNTGVVTSVAESGGKITSVWQGNNGFDWKGRDPSFDPHFGTLGVTAGYGKTVGWQFLAGRDFSEKLQMIRQALCSPNPQLNSWDYKILSANL